MPLSSSDIVFYYSNGATGPANATLSLGGTISSSTIPDATANNIFDDVTGDESSVGITEYRGIFIKDTNSTYTMINPDVWIDGCSRSTVVPDTISIARSTCTFGVSIGICTSTTTAPNETGLSWITENTAGPSNTIDYGACTVNATSYFGLWIKRGVPAGASAFSNRSATIKVQCETTASPFVHTITQTFKLEWTGNNFYVIPISLDQKT